ncbi:hypothetical protein F7734_06825 [Scytonema sp. UIC 10036]|uniref:COP23 domain-containing protein n=1 Tax=Scytonema sp. UIC 10036 TaxID=2304196 RepID=UPI0012DA291C|nr:COP23 domain-containing protein [Scytonema sp. UIC 10036]MUG92186.1 hypothetical protein [Scytonema sp. UIC 10036]
MKFQQLCLLGLTGGAIALTTTPTFSQSSSDSSVNFRCNSNQEIPTIVIYNKAKPKPEPLIYWNSKYIVSKDIVKDCESAAQTLQNHYNARKEFLAAVDGDSFAPQTRVCLTEQPDDSCAFNSSKLLFILKPEVQESLDKDLPEIIHPNLAQLEPKKLATAQFRAVRRIYYPKIQPRTFWQKLLGIV